MDLTIDILTEDKKSIVHLSGEIDAYTAPDLKEKLLPLTKHPDHVVEVNLENVNYMDSTGLGVFISGLKASKENGSHLKLVHPQEKVARLFKITGLDEVLDINSAIRGGS
ncbi:STAS domain-containing protein [Virgibacillus sp. YIM 98842]|jgi:anti-sigma B factor antagonist|uniref:STAS domain-containing protein n=1 Tax=Virgibacillus sp. YIM 98842 TaxID=2663533 RepID=UPI0013DAE1A3|nr:STAS domain-containing protein [Virgibacillus sp. YIM 98842]